MNTEKLVVGSIFILVGAWALLKRHISLEDTEVNFTGVNACIIGLVLIGIGICVIVFG